MALVIGNSAYSRAPQLANPRNDAGDMSAKLESLGFDVVSGFDLDLTQMRKTVREFINRLDGAKMALFFYAGHGLQVNGSNYLVPVDAELNSFEDLEFEALPVDVVVSAMERNTKTNLIVLDACRDNPLTRSLARSMGTRSTSVGQGLARIGSGVGTLVAFATQPGNVALDGKGRNSPFTGALLKHLGTPGQDITRDLILVRRDVLKATDGKQVPWENSSLTGEIVLKEGPSFANTTDGEVLRAAQEERKAAELARLEAERKLDELKQARRALELQESRQREELAKRKKELDEAEQKALAKAGSETGEPEIDAGRDPASLAPQDNLKRARELLDRRSYAMAARHMQAAAEAGVVVAMAEYGKLLSEGLGVEQDAVAGQHWFLKAALGGDATGLFMAGRNFERGDGGAAKDMVKAIEFYERAAKAGNGDAMNNLGVLFMLGEGVLQDASKAADWYRRGVEAGNANAMFNLAALEDEGNGVTRSPSAAAQSVVSAIVAGNEHAMLEMKNNHAAWSLEFRKAFQRELVQRKVYAGAIDGIFGVGTNAALDQLEKSKGD
ncbi:MAG: caspase family protein [Hyphomicrobiaceae bacterium]|nr:caspase family protein [Acidimicrobiales bacterium]MCB1512226.1 caspase family protein [Hyphomicrobiaceae bacterium]